MEHRVAVVGMGAVSPLGNDLRSFLDGIFVSKTGIAPITHFDSTKTGVSVAAEVNHFDPTRYMSRKTARRMDRFSQFAVTSAFEAMHNAGLTKGSYNPDDVGVIYGSGIGGLDTIEKQVIKMYRKGPRRVSPFFVPDAIINMAAGNISINLDARNMSEGIVTACSSGTNAIGDAFERIKQGKATYMITGGAEASVNEIGISGFAALTALSTSKDPKKASMPFDKDRNGFVMGEGAGTLVLEDWDHAKKRGAHILGEVVGYGSTSDAYKLTAPRPDGSGAIRAMKQAVDEGQIKTGDLDYVNAHGTATSDNDGAEAKAIAKCFSDNDHLEVSSTKGMTGHALGAAGALEAVIVIAALRRGQMPVNVGCYHQDPAARITLVNQHNNKKPIRTAISNSFGFGGHNAVLAFKKA